MRIMADFLMLTNPAWFLQETGRELGLTEAGTDRTRREMKFLRVLGVLTALLAGAPAISYAQLAYTAKDVHLRAGPAVDYPVVAILPAGVMVSVEGCLSDYRWCDVVAGLNRGWVYAGNIVYPYQGANVPVRTYGTVIGLGIVAFSLGSYWERYYRGRPWYSQRHEWIDRPRSEFGGDSRRPPPYAPAARPGNQRPPAQAPVVRPDIQRAPTQAPAVRSGSQRPPAQSQVPIGGQRLQQGQTPGSGQHSPKAQGPGDGKRPQQDHKPGGR
jgi:uncharacterized protein YraI